LPLLPLLGLAACGRGGGRDCAPSGDTPIARIGGETIYVRDVEPGVAFQVYRRQVDIYSLLQRAAEELADRRLLEREARLRGVSVEELLAAEVDARASPATEAEVDAYLEEHPEDAAGPPEEIRPRIAYYLTERRRIERRLALLGELRARSGYEFLLSPPERPRVALDLSDAPVRGAPTAPVTLVHFASFTSPDSARSVRYIEELWREFPGQLRWAHRNFPRDRDEAGLLAAEIGRMAYARGVFWEFHDAVFARGGALSRADLRDLAAQYGLDVEEVRREPRYLAEVKKDIDAGVRAGVEREPVVFVNGLYFSSTFPLDELRELVTRELEERERRGRR
jgi:hypothetical protein